MVRVDGEMPHFAYKYPTCREVFDRWGEAASKLHLVDFGLTTWWRDKETGKPIPEGRRKLRNKIGTARYASVNVHSGRMHARRDDLEGLAYIILDLLLGSLPWTGIQARNSKAGWDRMRTLKRDTFMSDLCAGHPIGIVKFVEYTKRLRFHEDPDYAYLKRLLKGSLPGGQYSEPTRSPFGGDTVPQDIVSHDVYNEKNEKREKEKEELGQKFQQMQEDTQKVQEVDSSGSSFKELLAKMRLQERRVGWYSYKHDEAPWEPDIDWDTKKPEDQNVTTRSWGENQPNIYWGQADEQDNWGSSQDKKDTNAGGWSTPEQQETGGWVSPDLQQQAAIQPTWASKDASPVLIAATGQWRNVGTEGWGRTIGDHIASDQHNANEWKQVGGGGGGANAAWRRVDRQQIKSTSDTWPPKRHLNRPAGGQSQQQPSAQRKQTPVTDDGRWKEPEAHRDSGTMSNAWNSQDYGGGWVVKDSKGGSNRPPRDKYARDTIPTRRGGPRKPR